MMLTGNPEMIHNQVAAPLFWALALGACLGGNGSLVGASANVVISQIAKKNKYDISFWTFSRYGFPIMILSLAISTAYIYVRYF
jgi:Na+/H+ antiporter NhaD/arsenite permease-like protein